MKEDVDGAAILADLESHRVDLFRCYEDETGYSKADVDFLWADMSMFFAGFADALAVQRKLMADDAIRYDALGSGCRIAYPAWGNVLIVLPTNALIPLLPMIAASFVAMGNAVTVVVPGKLRATAELLSAIVKRHLGERYDAPGAGIRAILYERLGQNIDLLYYIGGSVHKKDIITTCIEHQTDFIFEGEGKSIAIVDGQSEEFLRGVAGTVLTTKVRCLGWLCTSCNTVLVSRRAASVFREQLAIIAGGQSVAPASEREGVFRELGEMQTLHSGQKSGRQVDWASYAIESVPLNRDLFSSSFLVAEFDDHRQLRSALGRYDGGIEAALFVEEDIDAYRDLVFGCTNVGRVTINCDPTVQNSLLPWGGYASGGPSMVRTFFEKAVRRVIVEG